MQPYSSPLENLAAFAIAFVAGVLSVLGLSRYIEKIKKDTQHAEQAKHEQESPPPQP